MQTHFEGFPPPSRAPVAHLDPPETPAQPKRAPSTWDAYDTPPPLIETFRHSGWATNRRLTHDAMIRCRLPLHRIKAFSNCGTATWILRHKDDHTLFRAVSDHCHDRFCVPCASSRQAVIRRNLDHYLPLRPHRFLTLTIRNTDQPLAPLITRLYKAFSRLRARRFWRDRVRGGAAFLEVTYNTDRATWNPHLHCMLDGKYMDLQQLSKTWLAVTGDSQNVKIALIRDPRHVTNYITKYATKPLPPNVTRDPAALDECLTALARRRTILTFGTWKRWRLLDDPRDLDWICVAHVDELHHRATLDDPEAINILAMLHTADPHTGEFIVHTDPDPPYD